MQATKNAWEFIKKEKVLMVFGIFAAFLGQFGIVDFLGRLGLITGNTEHYFRNITLIGVQLGEFMIHMTSSLESKMLADFLLMLFLGLFSVFIFIAVVCQGAIIYSAKQSIQKKSINISKAWYAGTENFWRLFFINFFKKISLTLIFMVVSLSAYAAFFIPSLENNLFFLGIFLLASFAGLALSFVAVYASIYVIAGKYTISEAFDAACVLFRDHLVVSFEIGILILVFNLFFGVFAVLGFMLFVLPAILIWFAVILIVGSKIALAAGFIASFMVFTMYLILLGAIFTVFTTYIWTYVFMKMNKVGIKSRIVHYLSYKPNKI